MIRQGYYRRGLALITVMVLLTTLLYLTLSLLIRSNSNLFTSNRQVLSLQAFQAADSAAREKAMMLVQQYWLSGDAQTAVTRMQATINHDFPVYDASAATVGYADTTYRVDNPHLADASGTFGSNPYLTVTVEATGSTQDSSHPWRTTRTVDVSYNLAQAGLPADALGFAYFMNHWVWFTDFGLGQAQIVGNSAANGNYDVLHSSPGTQSFLTLYAGPGYTYGANGTTYTNNPFTGLYLRCQNTGYDPSIYGTVVGASGQQSPPKFGHIPVPRDLATIADDNGRYVALSRAQHGQLLLKTGKITSLGPPLTYSVTSTQTLTTTGVYGAAGTGQKENVVLTGTVNSSPRVNDVITVISLQGPVVVKGNVVLQGFIEGRGTLYAGRNIYVAGNLTVVNPTSCYPSSGTTSPSGVPQPTSADMTRDQWLLCAACSVVYGDVTNSSQWNTIMNWFGYVDPTTGEHVNDNREDAGLDGVVNSRQYNPSDVKEYDGMWTVEIQNTTSGDVKMADLPIVNNVAQVPPGWTVIPGTGEDADGNGRYTPPYDYNRDFLFASRQDSNGNWTAQSFTSAYFDNCPNTTYANFCKPVTRVDGFMMANDALAGWLGDNLHNLVIYGGEAGRQECMAVQLNGHNEIIYQDLRFSQQNNIGAPSAVRTSFARWSEK